MEHLRKEHGVSERRACKVLSQPRSTQRRREESSGRDLPLVRQLKELAARFPRWGTPKMTDFINKSGPPVNHKRIERLWRKEGMQVPKKARKRRRLGSSENGITRRAETEVNEVRSYDFVFDRTEDGRRLKILTVVDEYSRERLAIEVSRRFKASVVIDVLTGLMIERGTPRFLRSDNGTESIARQLHRWLGQHGVRALFIEPGSPWQNAFVESFNGKLRDQLLDCELSYNLEEARVLAAEYRTICNEIRPHTGLQGCHRSGYQGHWQFGQAGPLLTSAGARAVRPCWSSPVRASWATLSSAKLVHLPGGVALADPTCLLCHPPRPNPDTEEQMSARRVEMHRLQRRSASIAWGDRTARSRSSSGWAATTVQRYFDLLTASGSSRPADELPSPSRAPSRRRGWPRSRRASRRRARPRSTAIGSNAGEARCRSETPIHDHLRLHERPTTTAVFRR
ncbi:MAG: IS3 family transposase [Planctomycetota bacterium]